MSLRQLLHRFRQIDAWLIVPAILFVIWGELGHAQLIATLEFDVWDKALHFTVYCGLALMTTVAVRARPVAAMWLAFGLIVMGGALEILQGMTGRDADIWDEVANTLGVLTGTAVAWAGIAILRARKLVDDRPAD
jgi:VanZ family protein